MYSSTSNLFVDYYQYWYSTTIVHYKRGYLMSTTIRRMVPGTRYHYLVLYLVLYPSTSYYSSSTWYYGVVPPLVQ